jgi:hypothetical protein
MLSLQNVFLLKTDETRELVHAARKPAKSQARRRRTGVIAGAVTLGAAGGLYAASRSSGVRKAVRKLGAKVSSRVRTIRRVGAPKVRGLKRTEVSGAKAKIRMLDGKLRSVRIRNGSTRPHVNNIAGRNRAYTYRNTRAAVGLGVKPRKTVGLQAKYNNVVRSRIYTGARAPYKRTRK